MIEISHLTHIYPGSRKSAPRTAIDDLSLSIGTGEFCILSGPNGSGKSTLFRILCGMTLPSAGTITIGGFDLLREPAKARSQMAVVFQSPAIDKHLSVGENLRLHATLYGLSGGDYAERLSEAVDWTDLKERLDHKVDTLSGGLARQVELAKCLLTRPAILLLDEPSTGLDPNSRRNFLRALQTIQRSRKMTVLMTSHIFSEAEDADRVAIMKDGRLLALDSPQTLRARLGREMVVVQSRQADLLQGRIQAELGLKTRQYGDEIRLEETSNGDSLPVLEKLLARFRDEIDSIAIKQPTLEDVFIHLTGKSADQIEREQLETPPMIRVAFALAGREFIRFIRQPQRVVGTVAQPILFWLFLGSGFSSSFRAPGMEHVSYLEYFYPGVMLMMMLFASIFSSITIIEDRDAGFLQSVLVAPVSRLAIVLGKVLGGTAIAMVQTLIFTIAAPFLGLSLSLGSLALLIGAYVLTSMGFAAMGFFFAWPMRSSSGFHAIMMVFLMPLWMLSGALFPIEQVPGWLHILMTINPVAHALVLMRTPFYMTVDQAFADRRYLIALAVTLVWTAACLLGSMARVEKRDRGAALS